MEANIGVRALVPPALVNSPRLKTTMLSPLAAIVGISAWMSVYLLIRGEYEQSCPRPIRL